MACDRQNCGSIYSQQKSNMQTNNKTQKSTYKTSEWGREMFKVTGQLHSSSVHRGIIPLSPPQKRSRYFSYSCSCKRPQRPAERGSVPANAQESSRVTDGASQHPEDTAGSTLAPITAGTADFFSSFTPEIIVIKTPFKKR